MWKPRHHLIVLALAATLVALLAPVSSATLHIVNQIGTTFDPPSVPIVEGDTVRWVWSAGGHTVTNGTGAVDPNAGVLFDATLDTFNPTFEYVFMTAGTYPYFCRPHELFDMKGTIEVAVPTDVRPLSAAASLAQNYPNPFGAETSIAYSLASEASVTLSVYDVRGRRVAVIEHGVRARGPHSVRWDGTDLRGAPLPSGIYHYRLEMGDAVLSRRLLLLR